MPRPRLRRARPLPVAVPAVKRPWVLDVPAPRAARARVEPVISIVVLMIVSAPLLILPLAIPGGWLEGSKVIGQALPMLLGLMTFTAAEISLRRPLVSAVRLTRLGQAVRAEVLSSELTLLGGLAAPLTFLPSMMDPSPLMSGLPRRFHVRLLEGPSAGESIEFVCTSRMESKSNREGARVLILRNPSNPRDAGLWKMMRGFVREPEDEVR